jgi:hypothetical protein
MDITICHSDICEYGMALNSFNECEVCDYGMEGTEFHANMSDASV